MSFSLGLKQEILENRPMRVRCKQAQSYGLFLFSRSFTADQVMLRTENEETVKLFQWFARDILGRKTPFAQEAQRRGGKSVYTIALAMREDSRRLLEFYGHEEGAVNREVIDTPEKLGAFLAGAYLACGNITDPAKSYHMEFVMRDDSLSRSLAALLEETIPGAKTTSRRGNNVVYYKECGAIEDLMTLMGATRSCLAVIDIEMYKNVRNQANRTTNCETANIDKLVGAATSQVEDIRLILATKGEDDLPDGLLAVAKLRMENLDASLRELAELSPEPLSRSGIHHRLDKLGRIAAEIREQTGGKK